jgi:hypothetical protein
MWLKGDQQLLQVITTEFIEKFNKLNNTVADVYIKHLLYGNQKIKRCILHPFVDGDRIGLTINDEDVYITMDELQAVSATSAECIVKSEVMELYIIL